MKVLVQHLENLLPEHDCVVVPGLGGFVQSEVAARIQPGARLFYPASKEIGFNHRLKFNDGLLAQSYQEANDWSFDKANAEIQTAVNEINEKLEAGKFIRLGRIGTLFMIDEQLIFRPDHHNHFYPEAYGLTPFTFPLLNKPLASESSAVAAPVHKMEPTEEKRSAVKEKKAHVGRDEFIHIRFNRNRARQLMVGVAVFLFLLLFSKPAGSLSGSQQAGMMHQYLSKAAPTAVPAQADSVVQIAKDTVSVPSEIRSAVPNPGIQKAPLSKLPKVVTEADPPAYYIIVSAFQKRATAKRWMDEHEGESILNDAGIVVGKGHARVYVKSFKNESEANEFLNEFTSKHSQYASAWVYSSKID